MDGKRRVFFLGLMSLLVTGCLQTPHIRRANPETGAVTPSSDRTISPSVQENTPARSMKMYLVALDDAGRSGPAIGCGDSLVAVDVPAGNTKAALQELLNQHTMYYRQSGLYSALYQSNLVIGRFEIGEQKTEVNLIGKLVLGGTCDAPRIKEQLIATLRQSTDSVYSVSITVNGIPFDELLSQK
ncbi:MAG: hypothetical protein GYA15_12370 [Leptolinea sp.]|jgi:hypothetical protein|nr:hypothetical protein [Leptolinea sp.]